MERSNFIDIQKQVQILDDLFEKHVSNVKEAVNVYNQLSTATANIAPSSVISASKQISNSVAATNKVVQQQNKLLKQNVQAIFDQAKTYQSLAKQKEQALRQAEKERQQAEKLNNAYNRISALMRQATAEYNNLAARKNFGIKLTEKEEQRYLQLQARIERFNNVLKKTDADIGKFNRNVGNYGTQWDGLRFQTNQLIRELPAMAYGVNVFFGAISNNLPMFIDEVKKAREEQKLAIEQGKQAPSVISRITSALFNWQTALVLLITYLTLNGREIWNWTKQMIGAKQAIDDLAKAQLAYNKSREQSILATQKDVNTLKQNLDIAKNEALSMDVRKEAIKQIRKEYEYHSKALTDNMFLLGQTAEFEDRVTKAIEAHNKVIEYQKTIDDNKQRVIQLQEEIRLRNQFAETEKRLLEEQNKYAKGSIANQLTQKGLSSEQYEQLKGILDISKQELETLRQKEKLRIKERKDTGDIVLNLLRTEDIQSVINELNEDNISAQNQINRLREISIELDIKEEKSKKDKKKATYDYIDALASEYALKVLYFENEIETNKKISEDEKRSYNERAEAMKKMYDDQIVLSGIHRKEELRLLKIYYEEQKAEAKKANEDGIINKEELHKALLEIENDYINKTGIINKKHKDRLNEINNEIANGYDVIIRKLWEYRTLLNAISQGVLDERQKELDKLSKVNFGQATKSLEQFNENIQQLDQSEKLGKLYAALAKNESEMQRLLAMGVTMESDAYQKLTAERIELERQIQEEQAKTVKMSIEQVAKLERAYKQLFGGFTNEAMSSFPAFSKLVSDEFQGMLTNSTQLLEQYKSELKNLEEGSQEYIDKQKAIADLTRNMVLSVAVQMVEVFQEMYNFMQQNSDAYYQRQFEVLEMQKDVAIKFAGESVVAREEVERQYEERRRQIERERAKHQKEMAIFNATINLAQGIMATIGQLGFPKAIPMIALLTALGTAQIGMIASQPLPAYEKGTEYHPGGSAIVGEKRPEVVVEPGKKPYVVDKPSILDLAKGTKVIPSLSDWNKEVNSILMSHSIIPYSGSSNSLTKEDMRELISEISKNSSEKYEINIDKQGINATIMKGANRVKKLNSRIRIKSHR